ncbi:pyridoxamine 5'-phosphate oxidase family protein [Microbacterium sp. Mu-80]|uniref:Pyridoxamine 5'-phosphate oxidase family protein n=1 Tax=Microbacterium bandirmense TaxID=3122050 RepID=A0ABU8LDM7_9MICO
MVTELNEQECLELLETTTVGRVGFVDDDRVLIIPVNFLLHGRDIVIRTSPTGVLSTLPSHRERVAFEVDHHDDLAGAGWSVLLSGRMVQITADAVEGIPGASRKHPWAGGDRSLALRLATETISGRRVRRERT